MLTFVTALFFSCTSWKKEKPDVYSPVDYTEAQVLRDEIQKIEALRQEYPIKALWKTTTLKRIVPQDESIDALFLQCEQNVIESYTTYIEEKKYLFALRCYESLEAVKSARLTSLPYSASELKQLAVHDIEALQPSQSPQKEKVSEYIKGTVTVYVDKGIKVERGRGLPDAVLGSGFFISHDGYIVTNHHVISDCVDKSYEGFARLYILLAEDPDTRIPARVVGWDSVLDLALLKTEVDAPYVFTLGSSADLDVGDRVYAIGSPLGLDRTLTSGVISATDRDLFTLGKAFQIDAAVNSGNSGGPLIDGQGRVQAVVFAGVQNYQGLNFAIPVEYLRSELPILYAGGERKHPWLEAFGKTQRLAGSGAKNEGLSVLYTMPGGSAYLSGLESGETIIALGNQEITSIDDMHNAFVQRLEGGIVSITVQDKDGNTYEKVAYLAERPQYPGYEVYRHDLLGSALIPILGMELIKSSSLNKNLYTVRSVIKGSIADQAGFSETDPVQILRTHVSEEHSALYIELYAKKRKNGFLDVSLGLSASLDGLYYF